MDVVLVGLPGSGKSAVGRRLAASHHALFIDLDEVIEKQVGKTVPCHLRERGRSAVFGATSTKPSCRSGPRTRIPR